MPNRRVSNRRLSLACPAAQHPCSAQLQSILAVPQCPTACQTIEHGAVSKRRVPLPNGRVPLQSPTAEYPSSAQSQIILAVPNRRTPNARRQSMPGVPNRRISSFKRLPVAAPFCSANAIDQKSVRQFTVGEDGRVITAKTKSGS